MRRAIAVTALTAALLPAGVAWADPSPDPSGNVPDANIQQSIRALDLATTVTSVNTAEAVTPLEEEYSTGGRTVVRISSDVLFEFGAATLTDAARERLGEVAGRLTGATGRVLVIGYTDGIGSPQDNLRLSRQRAESVKARLAKALGGTSARLVASGRGEANPVEPNRVGGKDNPAGRAKNRRVEITFQR